MKEIPVAAITSAVREMCIEANCRLSPDVYEGLKKASGLEDTNRGKNILSQIIENADIARNETVPICQDTGMAIVFVELGQEVHIQGGLLSEAIHEGVRQGYQDGYLRKSVVNDPIRRENTKDNTPAIIHYDLVEGDSLKITVSPKGFGSENMSRLFMLSPSQGLVEAKKRIIQTVREAGPNPCPPIVVGIGLGGSFEHCAYLAKKALLRPLDQSSGDPEIKNLEDSLLQEVNSLGIGPGGLGGKVTALKVQILTAPTHIAGFPVAVNISCHATRHVERVL